MHALYLHCSLAFTHLSLNLTPSLSVTLFLSHFQSHFLLSPIRSPFSFSPHSLLFLSVLSPILFLCLSALCLLSPSFCISLSLSPTVLC